MRERERELVRSGDSNPFRRDFPPTEPSLHFIFISEREELCSVLCTTIFHQSIQIEFQRLRSYNCFDKKKSHKL